ncbi:MAG: 30S ribosomal protein S16 [Granulosicoccus sp.]
MVTIRLSRGGAKKQPFYHVVATDSRARRDGRYIERLGYYNPVARGNSVPVNIDIERVDYWIGVGAQMSDRVSKIVKQYRKSDATQAETVAESA